MKLIISDVASPELGQTNALQSLDWEDFTDVELGNNGLQRSRHGTGLDQQQWLQNTSQMPHPRSEYVKSTSDVDHRRA